MVETRRDPDSELAGSFWSRPAVLAGAIVALAIAAQVPAIQGGFFSDDTVYISDNLPLLAIPLSQPWRFFTQRTNPWEYLPIRDLWYRIEAALFGVSPLAFHVESLVLYALACGACFLAVRSVMRLLRGRRGDLVENASVVAAVALFATHPAHVESVAWIASQKDLLSGFFALVALWQFAEALAPERISWRRVGLVALLFTVAALSKMSVLPLALVALLLAWARFSSGLPVRSALGRAFAVTLPLMVVAALSVRAASGVSVAQDALHEPNPFGSGPLATIELALRILGSFAQIAVAPFRLRFHHSVRVSGLAGGTLVAAGVATAVVGAAGAWALVRRRSIAGLGAAAFALFALPFLQLIGFMTWSDASERWLFMPLLGVALAAAALISWATERGALRPVATAGAVLLAGALAATAYRSWEWSSPERLAASELARAPEHPRAVFLAMRALWEPEHLYPELRAAASGIDPSVNPRATELRRLFLLLADGWQDLREGRGPEALYRAEGELAENHGHDFDALRYYVAASAPWLARRVQERHRPDVESLQRDVALRPGDVTALTALADLESELLLDAEAIETYRRVLERAPDLGFVHYNLGIVLRRERRYAEAAAEYRAAARGIPAAWKEVAAIEQTLRNTTEAEQASRNAQLGR